MNKPWYDKEINDLVNYSDKRFETRIPCAEEVVKLNRFISDIRLFYTKRNKAKLIVPKNQSFLFRVFNSTSKPFEIDVPEDAVFAVSGQLKQMLYDKCDYLAELCGYKRKED